MDAIATLAADLRNPARATTAPPLTAAARERRWIDESQYAALRDPDTDPLVVAEEQGWYCQHCGQLMPPATFLPDPWRRPGRGMWLAPTHHGCETERVAIERAARIERQARDAEERRRWEARLERAGLTGRWATATFATFESRADWPRATDVRAMVAGYVDAVLAGTDRYWLILVGNYGVGKSHLAAACVRHALDARRRAHFCVWPEYLRRLKLSWAEESLEREADVLSEMEQGWLVALDDLDKQRPTEWARETLFSFLNARYNAQLPTIITLNTGLADRDPAAPGRLALEAILGNAILDRIAEMSTVVECDGPSYR